MRLRARKDENHNQIAELFLAAGATVHDTSQLGNGFPDMVIGIHGFNILVEVKDGEKSASRQRLTDAEFIFFDRWRGWMAVVRNDQDALNIIKQARQMKNYEMRGFLCINNHKEPEEESELARFARRFIDPDDLGYCVTASIRDAARQALGMHRSEEKHFEAKE